MERNGYDFASRDEIYEKLDAEFEANGGSRPTPAQIQGERERAVVDFECSSEERDANAAVSEEWKAELLERYADG